MKNEEKILELLINVSQKVDTIEQDLKSVKQDVAILKEDVAILKERMTNVEHDVRDLKHDVRDLKHDVSSLDRRVSKIEVQMIAMNAKQDATIDAVERLRETTIHIAENQSVMATALANHEQRIARLERLV